MKERRGATRAGLGCVVVGLLLGAACSSSTPSTIHLEKAEPGMKQIITKEWFPNLSVGAIACPSSVKGGKGEVSTCTVTVEGEKVRFHVVQTNDQGGVIPQRYDAILSTAKAETYVRSKYNDIVSISCGKSPYLVRAPKTTFRCDVTSTTGRKAQVIVEVLDPEGNVRRLGNT